METCCKKMIRYEGDLIGWEGKGKGKGRESGLIWNMVLPF